MLTQDKLEAAFQGFDVDHSNSVSFEEISNFLFSTKGLDEDLLREVMSRVQTSESGDISLE